MFEKSAFKEYQEALEKGLFLGTRCCNCDNFFYPFQEFCSFCHSFEMTRVFFKGEGFLRTFTVIRVPPQNFVAPYIVAMVELYEGPWVIGNLVDRDIESCTVSLIGNKVFLGSKKINVFNNKRILIFREKKNEFKKM